MAKNPVVTSTYTYTPPALPSKRDRRRAARVRAEFDEAALIRICEMGEREFTKAYDMTAWDCEQRWPADQFFFKDNGSDILFVAHLDTVVDDIDRAAYISDSPDGRVILSGALDDRLGAYIGLELLPRLGLKFDWLLTLGEEYGQSTAEFFRTGPDDVVDKQYKWMIEFDRGGTDVVMYDFETAHIARLVRNCGARVGHGSFSDIAYLEHLGCKGFNWGVGYAEYHTPRGYAFLNDTMEMVTKFLRFHASNKRTLLPHEKHKPKTSYSYGGGGRYGSQHWGEGHWWGDEEWEARKAQDEADAEHAKVAEPIGDSNEEAALPLLADADEDEHPWDRTDGKGDVVKELNAGRGGPR